MLIKTTLILLLTCFQISMAQTTKDSLSIIEVLKKDYEAFGSYDIEKHRSYLTNDYILIENGEIWNLNQEIDYLKKHKNSKTKRVDAFTISDVKIFDNIAYVVYNLYSTKTNEGTIKKFHWLESTVFRKVNGNWKIALIHSTKISKKEE